MTSEDLKYSAQVIDLDGTSYIPLYEKLHFDKHYMDKSIGTHLLTLLIMHVFHSDPLPQDLSPQVYNIKQLVMHLHTSVKNYSEELSEFKNGTVIGWPPLSHH